ncbi:MULTISPECIES: aspartate-alanine antiporter-like transporter [unclassified Jeotgalibaca]|uniref:aspartate-alanine antiporter-like transporter n=1 Tax=unclassified Jeotgalibaca TaxID=2621505 RepID=UPI003FCF0CD6
MSEVLLIILIVLLGRVFGRISFFGIKFGSAGVLLVGLVFGHYGFEISKIITDIGLLMFVTGVGLSAGPIFIQNFKNKATSYIVIAISTIAFASLMTVGIYNMFDLPLPLTIGVMTGALTSTPGLGAAVEATQSDLASIGYGIAYVFGVVGVILFVQLSIKFLKINAKDEARIFVANLNSGLSEKKKIHPFKFDKNGFFAFFLALLFGVLVGKLELPLPGGAALSLGNAGGALVSGLFFGYLGGIGPISLKITPEDSSLLSDFGLLLFYAGTGVSAGAGALEILQQYGLVLFLSGVAITVFSALAAFLVGHFIFRMNIIDTLGSVTGAMTATPGLGTLIDATETPQVAAIYASTYPIALLCVVLSAQILSLLG